MADRVEPTVGCRKAYAPVVLVAALLSVAPSVAHAQFSPSKPSVERLLHIQADIPRYADEPFTARSLRGALVLPVRERMTFVAGMSILHAADSLSPASVVISNAWGSLQLGSDGGFATITLSLPTTGRLTNQAYGADAGLVSDIERPERFTPRAVTISVYGTPRWRFGEDGVAGARLGVAIVSPSGVTSELYGRYAGFVDATMGPTRAGLEISGATFFGGVGAGFSEKSVAHALAHVTLEKLPAAPAFYVRLPLDDGGRGAIDSMFGVRVTFSR